MVTERVLKTAGWVDLKGLPKGPNGRAFCRYCGQEVPKGKRSFCSDECVHQHKIRSQPQYARECVLERDHGICAVCGFDGETFWKNRKDDFYDRLNQVDWRVETNEQRAERAVLWMEQQTGRSGWPKSIWYGHHLWQMDHVQPVVEGGGSCGLDNLRTLCLPCHRAVTKELRGRLSKARRQD